MANRKVYRAARPDDDPALKQRYRQRLQHWEDTDVGELLVLCGIMIRCGCRPLSNFSYQWAEELGDHKIKAAMKQKRWVAALLQDINACWSEADRRLRAPVVSSAGSSSSSRS